MTMTSGERPTDAPATASPPEAGAIPVDSFGNRLMLARAHAGHLSIREAAALCDIGRGAWTNWERGARPADILDVVQVVSEKLGVDRDWLLWGGSLSQAERRQASRTVKTTCKYSTAPSDRPGPRLIGHRPNGGRPARRSVVRTDLRRPATKRRTAGA